MAEQRTLEAERTEPGMEMYQCPFCDRRTAPPALGEDGLPQRWNERISEDERMHDDRAVIHAMESEIADLRVQLARQSAPEGAPVAQSTPLAGLWMHEDMERDAMRAALNAPRQDLKAAHEQAVEDTIYWKRRALTAEAATPMSASSQPADQNKMEKNDE